MTSSPTSIFLNSISSGRNVFLLLIVFILFTAVIMPAVESDIKSLSGGTGVIDLEFFYSPEKAQTMLNAYGQQGRSLYIVAQWTVDLIFPFIGAVFFMGLLRWSGAQRWYALGAVLACVDWTENILISIMLFQYPQFHTPVAYVSAGVTLLKWTTILLINSIVLFYLWKKYRTHSS